ncbi:MAG: hypothetical protein MUF34_00510 [Polyangiaceae bacterium]|nr:hypothetical protein [Polyangiaceae bacterium]
MKIWYLPWLREGFTPDGSPAPTGPAWRGRGQLQLGLRQEGADRGSVNRAFSLLGPGDAVSLAASQVLRVWPPRDAHAAETEFFPVVEFDDPSLPWALSPQAPSGARLLPWLALVVLEEGPGLLVERGPTGGSPWLLRLDADAASQLPDLNESWAWAHAQISAEDSAGIQDALRHAPDRTLSRLLAARRLLPRRGYRAAVVPTFAAGRLAGLAQDPSSLGAAGLQPAWGAPGALDLPAYVTWRFETGEAGDFESLARRLRPAPLDPSAPRPALSIDVGVPLPESKRKVDWEGAAHLHGSAPTLPARTPEVEAALRSALTTTSVNGVPVLGPPRYGARWQNAPLTFDASGGPWPAELNLTPAWRAAAGLGAGLVRAHQDELVAWAFTQLQAENRERAGRRRMQIATLVERKLSLRLNASDPLRKLQVLGEAALVLSPQASDVGFFTPAGRKIARSLLAPAPPAGVAPPASPPKGAVSPAASGAPVSTASRRLPPSAELTRAAAIGATATATTTATPAPGKPDPVLSIVLPPPGGGPLLRGAIALTAPVPMVMNLTMAMPPSEPVFESPSFPRPLASWLALEAPDSFAVAKVASDGVAALDPSPAFVEAALLGANEEMNRELLWRGFPCDGRRTPFRWFWDRPHDPLSAGLPPPDVPPIGQWAPSKRLGKTAAGAGPSLLITVRSELLRRHPTALIALVPARWINGFREPDVDPTKRKLPMCRVPVGLDAMLLGFQGVNAEQLVGTDVPAANQPGWYVLFAENPGDPRFGLDPPATPVPPLARDTLSWSHLTGGNTLTWVDVAAMPSLAGFTPASASSGSLAGLLRQKPFRAFLHGSRLLPRS